MVTLLSGFFGAISLFLAAAGLYGTLAYSITRRRREIGIRLALGAALRHILQTVCTRMFAAVIVGLGVGLVLAAFETRLLQHLLFGLQPLDPFTFLFPALAVLVCALAAAFIPMRRVMKTDPASALRAE